jgi:hypothetical protein
MQLTNDLLARSRRAANASAVITALFIGVLVGAAPAAAQADPSAVTALENTAGTQGTPPGPPANFNPQ